MTEADFQTLILACIAGGGFSVLTGGVAALAAAASGPNQGAADAEFITLQCSHCGNMLRIDRKYAGRTGACKKCKAEIEVPVPPVPAGTGSAPKEVAQNEGSQIEEAPIAPPREGSGEDLAVDALGALRFRLGAKLLDLLIIYALTRLVLMSAGHALLRILYFVHPFGTIALVYSVLFIGRFGATPGKILFELKIVRSNNEPVGYFRALGRTLVELLSMKLWFAGHAFALFTHGNCAIHDMAGDTRVIYDRHPEWTRWLDALRKKLDEHPLQARRAPSPLSRQITPPESVNTADETGEVRYCQSCGRKQAGASQESDTHYCSESCRRSFLSAKLARRMGTGMILGASSAQERFLRDAGRSAANMGQFCSYCGTKLGIDDKSCSACNKPASV